MPGKRSPDVIQVNLRITNDLHKRLVSTAKKDGRSLNAEMIARLERTFHREKADEILADALKREKEVKRLGEAMRKELAGFFGAIGRSPGGKEK